METAAALRKEERRARLSVRGAVIGAGAVSRNPLPGSGGGPRNRARRSVFRLPGLRAHISLLFRVSEGPHPRGMPFRSQVGTQPPGTSWILQWRLLETSMRPRKPPPDCRSLRTAFCLLRSSPLANPHPHGQCRSPERSCATGMPQARSVWRHHGLRVPNLGERREEFVAVSADLRKTEALGIERRRGRTGRAQRRVVEMDAAIGGERAHDNRWRGFTALDGPWAQHREELTDGSPRCRVER